MSQLVFLSLVIFSLFLTSVKANVHSSSSSSSSSSDNEDKSVESNTKFTFPVFPLVELTDSNHIVLKGEINEEMISKAIVAMSNIDLSSQESNEMIIYICSPGGSVLAGNNFIQFMNFLRQKGKTFTCVADQAASMAFSIFQECDNRYVTPTSILMQHQMSVRLHDQYENLKSRIHLLDALNQQSLVRQSSRVGLSVEEFKQKVVSDWWLYGEESTECHVSDKVVNVGCSPKLLEGTYDETINFYGVNYRLTFSTCPIGRSPLSFTKEKPSFDSSYNKNISDDTNAFAEYLKTLYLDQTTVRSYL